MCSNADNFYNEELWTQSLQQIIKLKEFNEIYVHA